MQQRCCRCCTGPPTQPKARPTRARRRRSQEVIGFGRAKTAGLRARRFFAYRNSRQAKPSSCVARPTHSSQPSASASAAREIRPVVLLRKVGADHVLQARPVEAREERARLAVVEMPERARDALLQPFGVAASPQHVEIVVALQHQRIASGQRVLDVPRRCADIGEHAQTECAVGKHELHRLARVVRHGVGLHLGCRRPRTRCGRRRCLCGPRRWRRPCPLRSLRAKCHA